MRRLRGNGGGFTIIELIVVIVVIGVLAAITTLGLIQYQTKTRDAERAANATVIAEALESYYNDNGEYPSCNAVTADASTVVADSGALAGVNEGALKTPTAAPSVTNSIDCVDMATTAGDYFSYVGDGSAQCTGASSCLQYKLQYQEESTGAIKTIYSRHKTPLAAVGATTVSFTSVGFTRFTVNWAALGNITQYRVQISTSTNFGSPIRNQVVNGATSLLITGLSAATTYYARVAPILDSVEGSYSPTQSRTTNQLNVTGLAANAPTKTQVNLSWTATLPSPVRYEVLHSLTNNVGTATVIAQPTSNSYSHTGRLPNDTYYYWVRAVAASPETYTGPNSSVASATTADLTVTGVTATANSGTQITASWTATTSPTPARYLVRYSTSSSMSSPVSAGSTTATSRTITGLTVGTTYYVQVMAQLDTPDYDGPWSAHDNATTVPAAPVCSSTAGSTNTQIVPDWDASSGATSYTVQYGPGNYNSTGNTTGTFLTINGLNNGTTYTSRVRAVVGTAVSGWTNCPNRTTGVDGPGGGWFAHGEAVRNRGAIAWMPGEDPGYGSTFWTNGIETTATCSPGATVVVQLQSYYAYSNNTSHNSISTLGWTVGNQQRFVVNGNNSWHVFWHGWIGCQVGGTRVERYLGNAGGY